MKAKELHLGLFAHGFESLSFNSKNQIQVFALGLWQDPLASKSNLESNKTRLKLKLKCSTIPLNYLC